MKKITFITLITSIILVISFNIRAQENPSILANVKDSTISPYFNNFKDMHIGYYGSTQNCEPYSVYAFKYRKHWFLFIYKDEKLSLLLVKPPVNDKNIDYPSKYLAEGLAKAYSLQYTKLKTRKRNVFDMDIYGFYKFNKFGRRVVKGLLLLEYPSYKTGLFGWIFSEEKAKKLAEEKAAEEAQKLNLETIKPEIEIDKNIPIEKK